MAMQNFLTSFRKMIFLSFILFTIFAGEGLGCGCEDQSKLQPSHSGQGNPKRKKLSSFNEEKK